MHDRLTPALHSQLAEDGVDVELGGVLADAEALGDALVGEALGEELEDFELARGQGLGQLFGWSGGVAEEERGEGVVEDQQSLGDSAEGGGQAVAVGVSGEGSPGAGG